MLWLDKPKVPGAVENSPPPDLIAMDVTFSQRRQSRVPNRAYLVGTAEKGWCAAMEIDGALAKYTLLVPSEAAAKQHAEGWERDESS
ncbi:MAG TPA: hypothetical protein VNY55_05685 [Mycobacterium sp.]|nr:hypothetical protein [Mycobacterium sp.]